MSNNKTREDLLKEMKTAMKPDFSYQTENNNRYENLVFGKAFEEGQSIKKEIEAAIEKLQNVSSTTTMYKIKKRNN